VPVEIQATLTDLKRKISTRTGLEIWRSEVRGQIFLLKSDKKMLFKDNVFPTMSRKITSVPSNFC
jgi:hypothetical protein